MKAPHDPVSALARAEALAGHDPVAATDTLAAWAELGDEAPERLGRAVGLALKLGAAPLAHALALRFVARAPAHPGSHHALALARRAAGDIDGALAAIDAALARAPAAPVLLADRAALLLHGGRNEEAAAAFARWLEVQPAAREARHGRGIALLRASRAEAALPDLEAWTATAPEQPDAWRALGEACELAGRYDTAVHARNREIALRPHERSRAREAGFAFARMGLNDRARELLDETARSEPGDLVARWVHWQALPLVYRDTADADAWREAWIDGLAAFEAIDPDAYPREIVASALLSATPFFMHYQGGDVTALQRRFGALATRWARRLHPSVPARAAPRAQGRLRVGFATAYYQAHTVHGLFHQWLARIDRGRFEVVAIHFGGIRDAHTAQVDALADEVIRDARDHDDWVARIAAADLDALVWLDIGMNGHPQALAPLRFAPVTAMAWGHPVTSGYSAVDAFLSAESMEPPDGARHYTERLVPLPRLGIRFPRPPGTRGAERAPRDAARPPRLVCAQTVYKLHPRNLDLVARIAARLPDAEIHFVPHPSPDVRARFAGVVRARFEANGAAHGERVMIHPGLAHDAFLALLARSDVFLDMPGWSGGHTTLEALATDLPVVTLPGEFMRQRHTHGMLKLMGLEHELAVADEAAYVERVVRLATDPVEHARIVAAIAARKHVLYDDDEAVRGLERFLLSACGRLAEPSG